MVDATAMAAGISRTVATILAGRGITELPAIQTFLDPQLKRLGNPFLFQDMDKAAARMIRAIRSREKVCIYGDYDADGMTSTALLKLFFRSVDFDAASFLPHREADGYGLNDLRIAELAGDGITLIICVDCGIKSVETARIAAAVGIDLVILDHHVPGPELPAVCAVVDPHRVDCQFPFKDLAAVGIAFYFCGALRKMLIDNGLIEAPGPDIRTLLDLVAIGTVADVMPLKGDNRILVKAGLERINTSPRAGITALKAVSEVRGHVSSGIISFKMAPRLNASGRMSHPDTSLKLLMSENDRDAATWAEMLQQDNTLRKEVGLFVLEAARAQIVAAGGPDAKAVVVAGSGWHQGVLGIVASRLVEEFSVPAVVLSISASEDDGRLTATGSARSVEGFDIGMALARLESLLLRCGGHPMAAGLGIDMARFDEFAAGFKKIADAQVPDEAAHKAINIDAEVTINELSQELTEQIKAMEPFGMGNPEPVLVIRDVQVTVAKKVGRDSSHMRVAFKLDNKFIDGIWFSGGESGICENMTVDVAFSLVADSHTGLPSMKVRDIRPS